MRWNLIILLFISFLFFAKKTYAIVPPDFAIQVATQGSQIVAYVGIIASVFFIFLWEYIKNIFSSKKARIIAFLGILLVFFFLIHYGLSYYENYQTQEKERYQLEQWGKVVSSSLSAAQQKTYEANKQAIDIFIAKLDKGVQEWMKNVTIVFLDDANNYLLQNNKNPFFLSDIELIDDSTLKKILVSRKKNQVILDVRDDYERKFVALDGVKVIRFGNLVNNEFAGLSKDTELIVLCHTDARSFVAANYLRSQGFTNIRLYKGGVMAWVENKNPVTINRQFEFIWDVLPYLTESDVERVKREGGVSELSFSAYSSLPDAINSLFMSDSQLDTFIAGLSSKKKYIIRCTDHHHCFDAVAFVDRAKSKNIEFIGYTGYSFVKK